jgi:CRP-like cAMP-binding protein
MRCRFCSTWVGAPTCTLGEWAHKYRARLDAGADARSTLLDLLETIEGAAKHGSFPRDAHGGRRDSVIDRAMAAGSFAVLDEDAESDNDDVETATLDQVTELLAVSLAEFGVEERHNAAFELDVDYTTRQAVLDRAHAVHKLGSEGKTRALRRRACRAVGINETFRIMMLAFRALAKRDPQAHSRSKAMDTADLHEFTGFKCKMVPCTAAAALLDDTRADASTSTADILQYRMRQLAEAGGVHVRRADGAGEGELALGELDPALQALLEEKMRGNNGEEMLAAYMGSLLEQLDNADRAAAYGKRQSSMEGDYTDEDHLDAMNRASAEHDAGMDDDERMRKQRRQSLRGSIRASLSLKKGVLKTVDATTQTGDGEAVAAPVEEKPDSKLVNGALVRKETVSRKAMVGMLDKVSVKGAKDLEWVMRQTIAILDERLTQCASQGLGGADCEQFTLPMDKFVVNMFGMQYGVPKLAKEKMLVFLKAVKKHGSKSVISTNKSVRPNALVALMYNSLISDGNMHMVNFVLHALTVLRHDMKANPLFPSAGGAKNPSKASAEYISFKRVVPIIATLFPTYLPQSRNAVKERVSLQKDRGMMPEWKSMQRARSFTLAKHWRVTHDQLLLVVLEERLRQCEIEDHLVHNLFKDSQSLDGISDNVAGKAALMSMATQINPTLSSTELSALWKDTLEVAGADEEACGTIYPEHFSLLARRTGLHRYSSLYRFFLRYAGRSSTGGTMAVQDEDKEADKEAESAAQAFMAQLQGKQAVASIPDVGLTLGGPAPQLSPDDLNSLLTDLGIVLTAPELGALIKQLDADGGGTIDWPEFVEYFASWQASDAESAQDTKNKRKQKGSGSASGSQAAAGIGTVAEDDDEDEDDDEADEDPEMNAKFMKQLAVGESALMDSMSAAAKQAVFDHVTPVHVKAGEVVICQGDLGDAMYFVQSGTLDVVLTDGEGHKKTVASLSPPDFFGERALLNDDPLRSASIVASANEAGCELYMLKRAAFLQIMEEHEDFAAEIKRKMSGYKQVQQVKRAACATVRCPAAAASPLRAALRWAAARPLCATFSPVRPSLPMLLPGTAVQGSKWGADMGHLVTREGATAHRARLGCVHAGRARNRHVFRQGRRAGR